ncbi:arginine--tRNA ligase [Candidatus Ichthyocystis sparus]|nr:arginine--tRNA ligase [Candidatus Ichthyocystis sparus]
MINPLKKAVAPIVRDALLTAYPGSSVSEEHILERPKDPSWGDISSAVALRLAKQLKQSPKSIAENIVKNISENNVVGSVSVVANGFINIRLSCHAFLELMNFVEDKQDYYGYSNEKKGKIIVEFVSANPTGPLHVGHGRQGAIGDILTNILSTQGWDVHKEFYYNDAGNQINSLTASVQARINGISPDDDKWPKDGYRGDYVFEIAKSYMEGANVEIDGKICTGKRDQEDTEAICNFAVSFLRKEQQDDLDLFGIHFDQFYLESSLYKDGTVDRIINRLTEQNETYEHEGALWLSSTKYNDSKDRVMRKSDGSFTYFVPDIAYHLRKWERGFIKAINVQGTDHHGTTARVRAGLQGLRCGIPEDYPLFLLHSMVKVFRNGKEVKISKRSGYYVTLRDLVNWVGRDAARFFLASRKPDSEVLLDVDLALKKSEDNPVFYVQYAYARSCAIINQANSRGMIQLDLGKVTKLPELGPTSRVLLVHIAEFPDVLKKCSEELSPHALTHYLKELAAVFHGFYNAERVLSDDSIMRSIRMRIVMTTQQVLRTGFKILGISAPKQM